MIKHIDILGHADFGGAFRKTSDVPGLCTFYSAIESVKNSNADGTLILDAGDNFCRKFWGGKKVMDGLSIIGTDAMTLGNHEFDYGKEFLISSIKDCKFPVLCANVLDKESGKLIEGTLPYTICIKKGIKIGIVGVTTEYTPYMVEKSAFQPFKMTSVVDALKKFIPIMRGEGAEIIVVLAHIPFYFDECGYSGELKQVIDNSPSADVWIGGHIPGDFAQVIGDISVVKGGFGGNSLPHISLAFDTDCNKITSQISEIIDVNKFSRRNCNPLIQQFVIETTGKFEEYFREELGVLEQTLTMQLAKESTLGNFLADSLREIIKTDLSYVNTTSTGERIEKGIITRESIMNAMRFDDPILQANIKGQDLIDLMKLVYEPERFSNNAGLAFSGYIVEVDNKADKYNKVKGVYMENGTPIGPEEYYTVVTSKYMASGGNDTYLVSKRLDWIDTGRTMHEVIFEYVSKKKVVLPTKLGRLIMEGMPEGNNAPF